MTAKEYGEENDMTTTAVIKQFNLKSWNSQVPEQIAVTDTSEEAEPVDDITITFDEMKAEIEADARLDDDPVVLATGKALQGLLGQKTRDYLRFVDANKLDLPVEYKRCEGWICKWVR